MTNNETLSSEFYSFDPSEVVGDDLNLLEYQIPFSQAAKLGGFVVGEAKKSDV